jgi:hypothetical protein
VRPGVELVLQRVDGSGKKRHLRFKPDSMRLDGAGACRHYKQEEHQVFHS